MIGERLQKKIADIVGEENLIDKYPEIYVYAFDGGIHRRVPDCLVRPHNSEQVQKIIQLAVEENLPVVPRGAGTALCGQVVPLRGGIVLDMQRMDKIIEIRPDGLYAVVEPGAICDKLNDQLGRQGFFIPAPASSEVATLGGMVGANSSGSKALKYGATRDIVLGLEVVTPVGDIITVGCKMVKQSSGFQLEKLYCGSEGMLGVITEVVVRIIPKPAARGACVAFFDSIGNTGKCVADIVSSGLVPSQLELMSETAIKAVNKAEGLGLPECAGMLLIELSGEVSSIGEQIEKAGRICNRAGAIKIEYTEDEKRIDALWKGRKQMIPSLSILQKEYATVMLADDMSVPVYHVPEAVAEIEKISSRYDIHIPAYGHAGDGNLHTKVLMDPLNPDHWKQAEEAVWEIYNMIYSLGGTTSGEHGIGITKAPLFHKERKGAISVMKAIKTALDPHNIMNPGKMIEWEGGFVTKLRYPVGEVKTRGLHLDKYISDMVTCTLCGYCKGVCPVFDSLGWDSNAARGKMLLSYGLVTGEVDFSDGVSEKLYQCVLCGDCARRCPSGINAPEIIQSARADVVEAGCGLDAHRMLASRVIDTGNIYGEKSFPVPQEWEGDMAVFLGCQYGFRMNKTKRYFRIMKAAGMSPFAMDVVCCGFPLKVLGYWRQLEEVKERFLKKYEKLAGKKVVTFCPSCAQFIREEYKINVEYIIPLLASAMEGCSFKKVLGDKKIITYHDPCDLSRRLRIVDEPRKIIELLGGSIVEMEHSREKSRCCGGGGGMLTTDMELSSAIAMARIEEVDATGAELLLTSCPTCEAVLKRAAANYKKRKIVVRDISDILWQAFK